MNESTAVESGAASGLRLRGRSNSLKIASRVDDLRDLFVAHTASAACTRASLASGPTVETHSSVWYVVLCSHTLVTPR